MKVILAAGYFFANCDAGCGGGEAYNFETRAVVGIESQQVDATGLGAPAWLSLRSIDADVTYPLRVSGSMLVLDSPFTPDGLGSAYDRDAFTPTGPMLPAGALGVTLLPSSVELVTQPPPSDTYRGRFEVVLLGAGEPKTVTVFVAPVLEPCAVYDDQVYSQTTTEIEPVATVNSAPPCLDGTNCVEANARVDVDANTIIIAPFRITARIQAWCAVSAY